MNCPECIRLHYKCEACWRRKIEKIPEYQISLLEDNVGYLEETVNHLTSPTKDQKIYEKWGYYNG